MGKVQDAVSDALVAEISSREGWDEPPGLYFLYLEDGKCYARRQALPGAVWRSGPPAAVLSAMAGCLGEVSGTLHQIAPEALHGVAFYTEAWTVMQPEAGTAQRSEVMADAMAHRVHTRPDRVEARTMWAVDRAGIVYGALQRRDVDKAPMVTVTYPKPGMPYAGDIPEALGRMVAAMIPETLPDRGRTL
jgi:hypothetical protein